jgi:hypothetical protein
MSTRVAVTASMLLEDISLLKRAALMFDYFAVDISERLTPKEVLVDLHWLADHNLVLDIKGSITSDRGDTVDVGKLPLLEAGMRKVLVPNSFMPIMEFKLRIISYTLHKQFGWTAAVLGTSVERLNRLRHIKIVQSYRTDRGTADRTRMTAPWLDSRTPPVVPLGDAKVIDMVLHQLPQPDENTPWEAILDWRADADAQVKFRRLKLWMSNVVRGEKSPKDLEDELRYLIDEYRNYMALHNIKANTGVIRTLFVTAADIAGKVASLKWGEAAKALFVFHERRIALLEAEQKAPGREVAYIVEAQKKFRQMN